jgi:hypothetical protein
LRMSWLIVGIRYLQFKTGLAPLLLFATGLCPGSDANPFAQNQIAPSASRAEGRLVFAEDRGANRDHALMI